MKILFKRQKAYPDIERELAQLDSRLLKIVKTMSAIAWEVWGDYLVVTRIKEHTKDGSTHAKQDKPYRHIDIAILENGDSETLRRIINVLYPYGVSGFYTIPPLDHGTAPHFHVQCKPL